MRRCARAAARAHERARSRAHLRLNAPRSPQDLHASPHVPSENRLRFAEHAPTAHTEPASLIRYLMETEAGVCFKDEVDQAVNPGYFARFPGEHIFLGAMLKKARAGDYAAGAGSARMWGDFVTLIRRSKTYNPPNRFEWRLADELEHVLRGLKRAYCHQLGEAAGAAAAGGASADAGDCALRLREVAKAAAEAATADSAAGKPATLAAGSRRRDDSKLSTARPNCLTLLPQPLRRAASRAACTAGSSRPTNVPMMAIATSSSTSVNPRRLLD